MAVLKRIAQGAVGLVGLYIVIGLALVFWPASAEPAARGPAAADPAIAAAEANSSTRSFTMRDGAVLQGRQFGPNSDTAVLMLHGVGASGSGLAPTAAGIARSTHATVVTVDLRGHGRSGGKPWAVSYSGQYDDDVSDLLAALRRDGAKRVVLAGHSMGGGIALRHALRPDQPVDGYLLLAPLLGSDAPSMRQGAPTGSGSPSYATFRTPRLFGALMFSLVGVHWFDDLPILTLSEPGKKPAYGFAALTSMQPNAPHDYREALAAIHVPLLLIAGTRDEAFNSSAYPGILAAAHKGRAILVPGATHNSVLRDERTIGSISNWLAQTLAPAARS
jgi:pimeloyl-ACP methyl ester carboxylesterase